MKKRLLLLLPVILLLNACSTMSSEEKDSKRDMLDAMAKDTIDKLIEEDASIKDKLDEALAYAVFDVTLTKIPLVGAGGGEGVSFDKKTGETAYVTASRLDLGGGVGARAFKLLLVIHSEDAYKQFKGGALGFDASAEAAAGDVSAGGGSSGEADISGEEDKGFATYELSDGGASVYVSVRAIRIKKHSTLN